MSATRVLHVVGFVDDDQVEPSGPLRASSSTSQRGGGACSDAIASQRPATHSPASEKISRARGPSSDLELAVEPLEHL